MAAEAPPDQTLAVALEWIEAHCVIPDGFRKGDWFRLYDWQLTYFAGHYLVKGTAEQDLANPVLAPAFRFRRSIVVGPQKLGKNPMVAAHICLEGGGPALFGGWAGKDDGYSCADWGCSCGWEYPYEPGEPMGMRWPTPLIQVTAFSSEQTDNTWDVLRPMIDEGPLSALMPKTGEEFIRIGRDGRIDVVTSSAQSRLGQRVTFVPQDEVGIWTPRNGMTRVADTQYRGLAGMGGRAALTTNAWDSLEKSVGQREFESPDRDIYRQYLRPPAKLRYSNRTHRARIHRIVYPPEVRRENGGHIDLDAIEAEADSMARRDPDQAARFYGNIVTASGGKAIDPLRWAKLLAKGPAPKAGTRIGVGFDGSISRDTTALVCCTAAGRLFVPVVDGKATIWQRPPHADEGWRIPRLEVEAAVEWIHEHYDVGRMLCDPPKWATEIETWQGRWNPEKVEDAIVLMFDTNQPRRMSGACDRMLTAVAEGTVAHDGTEVLTEHVLAMAKRKAYVKVEDEADGRTRYVFVKSDDSLQIDAGIAATLALEAAMTMPAKKKKLTFAY